MPNAAIKPRKSIAQLKLFFKEQHILMMLLKEFRDGILICDAEGIILQTNRSLRNFLQMTGDISGRRATDLIPDPQFKSMLEAFFETGSSSLEEITLRPRAGQEMYFEVHVVPIFIPDEAVPENAADLVQSEDAPETLREADGCVVIFHDMTDARRTEKMRRDFVANVSHELRTPLTAIEGYSETLLDGALEDQSVCRDFVNVIYRHSLRLTQLVEDLLDLSKLESPDYKPEISPVSLPNLLQQVMMLIEDKAEEKEIEVSVSIQESLPLVMAELSSLQQVLTNLLDNAIKYTSTQGRVSVSVFENDQGMIQVDVRDNGIGIEAKYLPRVFERFYRVDKARSREMGGTGLGLSIVKHIVQLHGGEIWVNSQVNEGSTFSFTLNKA
ncbi:MAG TPA: ATP-binding protein [Coleofasciculaceae cyanobacterium]|jgi:two-component system phosphate regulon sensor histidine kinase PhoR